MWAFCFSSPTVISFTLSGHTMNYTTHWCPWPVTHWKQLELYATTNVMKEQEIVLQSVSETRNMNTNRWNMESSGQTREGMQRWEKLNEWDWICISFQTARGSDSPSLFVCLSSGPAVRFSSFSPSGPTPPPLIGQHTVEVLRDVLSYSDDIIETLLESKAVVQNKVSWLAERKIFKERKEKTKTDHF